MQENDCWFISTTALIATDVHGGGARSGENIVISPFPKSSGACCRSDSLCRVGRR